MREYIDKKNNQKKPYYTNRFFKPKELAKLEVSSDEIFNADYIKLTEKFTINEAYIQAGQMVIFIEPKDNFELIKFLKEELLYNNLSEMSAVDFLEKDGIFEVFYQMLSMEKRKRLRVKCKLKENEPLKSICELYDSANWAEREAYDMFGLFITGHPYMKRLLMPDDWSGYPLRKSYPLHGDEAAQWYEIDQIFGKEYRDIIGPEIRDSAYIDKDDTRGYSRKGHEVHFGEKYTDKPTDMNDYQEDGGVFLVTKLRKDKIKTLEKRK